MTNIPYKKLTLAGAVGALMLVSDLASAHVSYNLANNPSILLADEPTGSLDAKNATILGELLLDINREFGITIILATHSPALAEKMSRRMKLEDGLLSEVK